MIAWLKDHNIDVDETWTKVELYSVIKDRRSQVCTCFMSAPFEMNRCCCIGIEGQDDACLLCWYRLGSVCVARACLRMCVCSVCALACEAEASNGCLSYIKWSCFHSYVSSIHVHL